MKIDESDLANMTVNERLFVCGLLQDFDLAVRSQDRARVSKILKSVKVDELSIKKIVAEFDARD
jgi:hypothetical protein